MVVYIWFSEPAPWLFSQASPFVLSTRHILHRVQSWVSRELASYLEGKEILFGVLHRRMKCVH